MATPLGEQIRDLVLHGDHVAPWAEAALYVAARSQHVDQVIRPALERGSTVVCDRYLDTSVAYQGAGRGLGVDVVLDLNLRAVGGLLPDKTVLVEIDAETALARVGDKADRIERAGTEFWPRVVEAYAALAARYPERYVVVDGGARSRRSRRRSVATFADVPEQPEAKRLLEAALADVRRTPTCSMGRRAWASDSPRARSRPSCWVTRDGSTGARIPTSG